MVIVPCNCGTHGPPFTTTLLGSMGRERAVKTARPDRAQARVPRTRSLRRASHATASANASRLASASTNSSHSFLLFSTSTRYRKTVLSAPLAWRASHGEAKVCGRERQPPQARVLGREKRGRTA